MSSPGHLSELDALRSQVADLSRQLAERDRSAQHQREQSDLLRAIVKGAGAEIGEEFFSALVTHLTSVLHVQYALIGEVQGDHIKKIRTLAVSAGGVIVDNFEYALAHTPCASALIQSFACFDRGLQTLFPQFTRLADLGAESYCAVPLRTKGGAVMGLLVVMDTKPLQQGDDLRSLLEVFAPRVAAEFEWRRVEQERVQALADSHNVIETIPDIVFALDTQGNVVKWNRRLEDITGYSSEEIWNKPALVFVPPEEQARTATAIQRVFMEGYAELEGHLLTKEHRLIPYHWAGALLKNRDGEPVGITGIGRDVSEKKRAEEALRRSEERFALAVEGSNDMLWDAHRLPGEPWYAPQTPIWWSPRVRELLGLEESEPFETLDQWAVRLHPDDKDRVFGQLAAHIEHRVPYDAEYRLCNNRGDYLWIRGRGQASWDEQGEIRRMSGSCQDITERKRADQAVLESRQQLQAVVEGTSDAVYVKDAMGRYLLFNSAAGRFVGKNAAEVVGHDDTFIFSHADAQVVMEGDRAVMAGGLTLSYEEHLTTADGERRTFHSTKGPWLNADGQVAGLFGVARDITERNQAEEAIREAELRYRTIFEQAGVGVAQIESHTGRFVQVNRRYCEIVGLTEAEMLATTFGVITHPDDLRSDIENMTQLLRGEIRSFTMEKRYVRPDGGIVWVNLNVAPLWRPGEQATHHIAIVEDITDRKRADEALRKSEERYARATAVGKVGVWELDVASGTYYGDTNLKALFGYVNDELSSDPDVWLNLVHPDDQAIALDHWQRIVNGESDNYNFELRMLKKDGKVIWTDVRGHAVRNHEGQVTHLFGATVDISERKQAQDALAQSERQLRTVLDALPVGVWFTDQSGKPLFANPAAKQIWSGIKEVGIEAAANTDGWWKAIRPSSELHRWALSHALTTGVPSLHESLDLECLDGTKKTIRNLAVPVRDEAGVVLGAIVVNEDITLLRQAQETLRLTQFSVDHAVEGFFWISPDARILRVNDAACRMLEYSWDELTAMTVSDIDPTIPPEVWPAHWRELKQNGSLTFESKHCSKTGRVLDTEVTFKYLQYEGKEYNCAIMRDIGERKQADVALRASEERYRALYDDTPTMYFTLATDGTVRSVNRYGAEQLGYRVEELIGHSVLGLFHEQDKEAVAASLSECLATPAITRYWEFRKIGKDGSVIWVMETARVGHSSTGETVVLITCEDITERKQAEEAFRRSEECFRTMFTQAPIGMTLIDSLTGQIYEANSKFAQISGRTKEEVSSLNWMSITHPDDVQTDLDNMARLNAREIAGFQMEKRYIWPDGKVVWINLTVAPIQVEEYAGPRHLAMVEDITERKRAEQEQNRLIEDLTRSRQHFQALFNWTPSAVGISTVAEGRFIDVNEGFSRLTGYMREEVMGRTTLELGLWADLSERESVLREILEQGYLHNREGLLQTKSGEIRSLIVSVDSIQLGSTPCLIYLCHDITERKRMEDALRMRERELQAALQERERISQDLHDGILQSLFAVGLNLEVAKSLMPPKTRKTSGASLDKAIDQLNRVLREIRSFIARLDLDLLEGKDLPTALQHALKSLTENQATRVRLAIEDRAAKAISVEQSLHLFHVIQEAVSNCIRHGGAQEARVSLKMLKQGVRLSIRDNGRGFNPNVAKGVGHGLANMAARAKKIGGRFTILSKKNEGTRIVLDLPKEASNVSR